MATDLINKYRTRAPPKEHEEAVRMLLEGIGAKQNVQGSELLRQTTPTGAAAAANRPPMKGAGYEYDGASVNSANSSLNETLVEQQSTIQRNGKVNRDVSGRLRSKATSTSESALSSVSMEHDAAYREPIPSRTIAVQCDLNPSSTLKRDKNLSDGSMQVSSISSTKYGFYNFTPEALETRRKLQRSISSRNVAPPAINNSRLSGASNNLPPLAAAVNNDNNNNNNNNNSRMSVEAPTFMSDLSSSSSYSISDDDRRRRSQAFRNQSHHLVTTKGTVTTNGARNSGSDSAPKLVPAAAASNTIYNSNHRRQMPASAMRGAPLYASTLDNSSRPTNNNHYSKGARLDSLPRRPMTALSYVSTTKLRGQTSPDRSSNGSCEPTAQQIKNRALSQQVLSPPTTILDATERRPRTPAPELRHSSLGSDSETSSSIEGNSFEQPTSNRYHQAKVQQRSENDVRLLSASKSVQKMPIKPPRPTLVSSVHNEQVQDFKALEKIGLVRPPSSNLGSSRHQIHQEQSSIRATGFQMNDRPKAEGQPNWLNSSARAAEMQEDENYNNLHDDSSYLSSKRKYSGPAIQSNGLILNGGGERPHGLGPTGLANGSRVNSTLSLSRRASRPFVETTNHTNGNNNSQAASGYYTASRKPSHTLSRADRAYSQTLLNNPSMYRRLVQEADGGTSNELVGEQRARRHVSSSSGSDVCRPTSTRQVGARGPDGFGSPIYTVPASEQEMRGENCFVQPELGQEDLGSFRGSARTETRDYRGEHGRANGSDNSESPLTRTWANPSAKSTLRATLNNNNNIITNNRLGDERKSSRSFSVRNINDEASYDPYEANNYSSYNSSSESSSSMANAHRFVRSHQLDFDSQHRLNESGLPEVNSATLNHQPRRTTATSYLGVTGRKSGALNTNHLFSSGRSPQITGRAMSQQSLTRPTMPLMSGRRRVGGGGGSNSGSDVGGSSMSLVSRLHGRYENAHTRSPIVMYIPQATPRPSLPSAIGKSSTLRKSSRSKLKSGSQDRSRRSLSRDQSDSETSSMLRTLVRPRNRIQGNYSSKRGSRTNERDAEEEDLDNLGQLATEMDSYKFRRRYSVPKDAKINWFAKLKQRVTSGAK